MSDVFEVNGPAGDEHKTKKEKRKNKGTVKKDKKYTKKEKSSGH